MKCPKCGYDLETIKWRNVDIDKCFRCGVIALDDGELETLAGSEQPGGLLSSFKGLFKG
jgi:Zn-finger nucleic acid-binding protein